MLKPMSRIRGQGECARVKLRRQRACWRLSWNGRRLDFDYKRDEKGSPVRRCDRPGTSFNDVSKRVAERSMFVLLQNDVTVTSENDLLAITQTSQQLDKLSHQWFIFYDSASSIQVKPDDDKQPLPSLNIMVPSLSLSLWPSDSKLVWIKPCCRAMYSFHSKPRGELGFKRGRPHRLYCQVDANWYGARWAAGRDSSPVQLRWMCLVPLPFG
uniref:Uncharacterized protein n=1 Tax=Seriola dumerili TaxID=41447 RepID=A0A3B4VG89_SERDU